MAEIDDGGPAFPTVMPEPGVYSLGMSFRDWLVGQALKGLLSGRGGEGGFKYPELGDYLDKAEWLADEHLRRRAERMKGGTDD